MDTIEPVESVIFLSREVALFFGPKRLCDFFCFNRLHDFFCPQRLRDFFVPRGCVIFFVPKHCIFFPKRWCDFFSERFRTAAPVTRGLLTIYIYMETVLRLRAIKEHNSILFTWYQRPPAPWHTRGPPLSPLHPLQ